MNREHVLALKQAKAAIKRNGTNFELALKGTASVNPDKEWEILQPESQVLSLVGVFLTKRQRPINGSVIQRQDLTVLCVPTDPPLTNEAIQGSIVTRLRDGFQFVVTELEVVAPGEIEILYKIKGIV